VADVPCWLPSSAGGCSPQAAVAVDSARAATPLLRRALHDEVVGPGVTFHDLITLAVGIALATEHHAEPAILADRLFTLTVEGLSPSPRPRP